MVSSTPPPELSEPNEELPRRFGNYQLLHPLAYGGIGKVYLARQISLAGIERFCVVKTLRERHRASQEYVGRFLDEARVVVHLSHRNICSVFDIGAVGDTLFLAMEMVAGRTLSNVQHKLQLLDRELPQELGLRIAIEILDALDYAHTLKHPVSGEQLNIVHRDVTPQNVMIGYDGSVKLIDFGLAASSLKQERTAAGVVMGKVAYLAPEQVKMDRVDARSDIFAMGVLLYEMAAGERYYEGLVTDQIWEAIADKDYRPRRWQDLPAGMQRILMRALDHDVEQRYATCADFRQALESYGSNRGMVVRNEHLRALMEELYPGGAADHRQLLADHAKGPYQAEPSAGRPQASTDTSADPATPSAPLPPPPEVESEAEARVEPAADGPAATPELEDIAPTTALVVPSLEPAPQQEEENTDVVVPPRSLQRAGLDLKLRRLVLVAVVLVMGAAGWMAGLRLIGDSASREAGPTLRPIKVVIADAPAPDAGAAASDGRADAASSDATVDAAADLADASQAELAAADGATPPPTPRPPRRPPRKHKKPSERCARWERPLGTTGEKLGYLRACGQRCPCARQVLGTAQQVGRLEVAQMREFLLQLDACVQSCR